MLTGWLTRRKPLHAAKKNATSFRKLRGPWTRGLRYEGLESRRLLAVLEGHFTAPTTGSGTYYESIPFYIPYFPDPLYVSASTTFTGALRFGYTYDTCAAKFQSLWLEPSSLAVPPFRGTGSWNGYPGYGDARGVSAAFGTSLTVPDSQDRVSLSGSGMSFNQGLVDVYGVVGFITQVDLAASPISFGFQNSAGTFAARQNRVTGQVQVDYSFPALVTQEATPDGYNRSVHVSLSGHGSFTVPVEPLHFQITAPPSEVLANQAFELTVSAVCPNGQVHTDYTGPVTIQVATQSGTGRLAGTRTVNAVNGVATFNNLSLSGGGNSVTLMATGSGAANSSPSSSILVKDRGRFSATTPTQVFQWEPLDITLEAADFNGAIDTDFNGPVTLEATRVTLDAEPPPATFSVVATAQQGLVAFEHLLLEQPGSYRLTARGTGFESVTTNLEVIPSVSFATVPSATVPGMLDLVVGGTPDADNVTLAAFGGSNVQATVQRQNGITVSRTYNFNGIARVLANLGSGDDVLDGRALNFLPLSARGEAGQDMILGGIAADEIFGDDGHDTLWGGLGNDVLDGGLGIDRVFGEEGDDSLYAGTDIGIGRDSLAGNDGNDLLYGSNAGDDLVGGAGDDMIIGQGGDDNLWGGDGNDGLWGGDGNDLLDGDAGQDGLIGGFGADLLRGGSGDDLLIPYEVTLNSSTIDGIAAMGAEWTSSHSYEERVANLQGLGNGSGLNGFQTVFNALYVDDISIDALWGGDGQDWFLFDAIDLLGDQEADEAGTPI